MGKLDSKGGRGWRPGSRKAKDEDTQARLAAIVENSPDAILVIDLTGVVTDWNHGAELLYGFDAEEMIGRSISAVVPLEASAELDDVLKTVRGGEVIGPYDTVRLRKDGSPVHVSLTASPITDVRGAVTGISWIARDITERMQATEALRESEAQLTALYEHSPAGVVLSEAQSGRILRVNATFERTLGYSREEALGRTMAELGMVSSREEREGGVGDLRHKESYSNREMTVHAKGGRPVFILASAQLVEVGGRRCVVNAAVDLSERRAAEDALREADRHKDEFLAMLSHELRNPMAAISAAVQYMRMRGLNNPELERARETAERQVRHMARLLDDLLDVARITRGAILLRTQEVSLDAVVETAVGTARPAIEAKRQVLTVSLPEERLPLSGDPTRLAQVVANLLDNASRYTPAGGHILLAVSREAGQARIRVRDDGKGIPDSLLPRVFDLFVQGERSLGRSGGGLGIGLTTVQRLVELHGGRVEARSDGEGRGSEFTVWLPLQPAEQPAGAKPEARRGPRRRILVVDDVADAAEMLAMVVERDGHEARVASSGPAALELAAAYRPDVVLLDLGMPGMDGYEAARRLRERRTGTPLLIVAVTGYGLQADRERTRAAGFDHHLVKPVDVDELRSLLGRSVVPAAVREPTLQSG